MISGAYDLVPEFLEGERGRLFALSVLPKRRFGGLGVLLIPPFAEEMNKSRRMFALQARAFACAGVPALLVDLFGTGESEGELADASLGLWVSDLRVGLERLADLGCSQAGLLGLRFGALLVGELARRSELPIVAAILWQPVALGKVYMNQFLRLRAMSELTTGRDASSVADLRAALSSGQPLEIAGYLVSSALYNEIEALKLDDQLCGSDVDRITIAEVSRHEPPQATPAINAVKRRLEECGQQVETTALQGEPFWQTPEITTVPGLIDFSVDALLTPKVGT